MNQQTYRKVLRRLKAAGVPDAPTSAKVLFKHAQTHNLIFETLLERRVKREPLQYIVGDWDFHNIRGLLVRPPVLIPRPETEELVEFILSKCSQTNGAPIQVLDIGTGTGAIGLALVFAKPECFQVTAIDSLPDACVLSNENAQRLGFTPQQFHTTCTTLRDFISKKKFDIVVSNPPYIPTRFLDSLQIEVREFEDVHALVSGEDGGDLAREIIDRCSLDLLKPGGSLFLELHDTHDQVVVKQWLQQKPNRLNLKDSFVDFRGFQRFHWLSMEQEYV